MNKKKTYFLLFLFLGTVFYSVSLLIYSNFSANNQTTSFADEPEIITLKGSSEEIGYTYGLHFKDDILKSLNQFWSQIAEAGYSREDVLENIEGEVNVLKSSSPNIISEWEAMAKAVGVSFDDITAINLFHESLYSKSGDVDCCTSWMATGSATLDGKTITHKNCDSDRKYHTIVRVEEDDKNTYIAVVSDGNSVRAGMNDKGLVISNNYVDAVLSQTNYLFGTSPNVLERKILQECDSVDDVFPYIEGITRKYGSLYFVADEEKAAIIEFTAYKMTTPEQSIITDDVAARSNRFQVLTDYNRVDYESDREQYRVASEYLEARKGSVTLEDINELSRYHADTGTHEDGYHLCTDGTVFGASFVVDLDYPGTLNTMWVAMSNPCVSLYTPFHMGSTSIHARWNSADAWNLAEYIRNNGEIPFESLVSHLKALENQMISEEQSINNIAYNYLENNQASQAVAELEDFDLAKGNIVWAEMTEINENNGPLNPDTEPPAQVTGLSATTLSDSSILLDWIANSESDLDHYNVYRDGQIIASNVIPSEYTDTGLTADTSYSYQISAVDTSGNEGSLSTAASATTEEAPQPDTEPPAQVTGLSATTLSASSIALDWNANSESDLDHYNVYRDGQVIASNVVPSEFTDTGLIADTAYSYQVSAIDTSGNEGTLSTVATATTDVIQQQVMYVESITMDSSKRWSWFYIYVVGYRIYADIVVCDGNGAELSGVEVTIELVIPDGSTEIISGTTDSNGQVSLDVAVDKIEGTYVSNIVSLSRSGYTYVPSMGVEQEPLDVE